MEHHPASGAPRRRERSLFYSISSALMLVLSVEMMLLAGAFLLSGLHRQLKQNAQEILSKQVENRADYLTHMLQDAQQLDLLAVQINSMAQTLLEEGGISLDTLDSGSEAALPLLRQAAPALVNALRSRQVSGVMLVINTQDMDQRVRETAMPAIFLRDQDPDAPPSTQNADLSLLRAPAAIVEALCLGTEAGWEPALRYRGAGKQGFVYPPFQAALQDEGRQPASAYGHWLSTPYILTGDTHPAIAYTMPLILEDGTVYGVVGVEILLEYLQSKLPYTELHSDGAGFYFLATSSQGEDGGLLLEPVTAAGLEDLPEDGPLPCEAEGAYLRFTHNGRTYIGSQQAVTLYDRSASFSGEHWVLVGAVEESQLYAFAESVHRLLLLTVLVTLAVGAVCSLLVAGRLAWPITRLSDEVAAAQAHPVSLPSLSRTNIREIDRFAEEITRLSQNVLDTSTKFLRIMERAGVQMGGYELQGDSFYITENFFAILGLPAPDPATLTAAQLRAQLHTLCTMQLYRTAQDGARILTVPREDGLRYIMLRVIDEEGAEAGLLKDVTENVREWMRVEHDRDYDMLTGLYNRQAFQRVCEALFAEPEQLGVAALLMMDLDGLKQINDTYGHDWGDQYIRQTGKCLEEATPEGTVCARMSGDEFLLLFYGYKDKAQLRGKLDALHEALRSSVSYLPGGRELRISISGGVAWYPEDGADLAALKKYADFAMYQVKRTRKGQLRDFDLGVYNQEAYAAQARAELERVLAGERVTYHFQPIFSAKDGATAAYEALMRVDMPTLRTPAAVLQLAREAGRLYELEKLTLRKASESFERLQAEGLVQADALLFINSLGSVSLNDADALAYRRRFPDLLRRIVTELTEQQERDLEALERKRSMTGGSGLLALDDYGSGYSNELALLEVAPRYIKLDINIVRDVDTHPDKRQIVLNALAYAKPRGIRVVAEGVETAAELRTLLELGVDLLQGYYLALPAAEPARISPEALALIRAVNGNKA